MALAFGSLVVSPSQHGIELRNDHIDRISDAADSFGYLLSQIIWQIQGIVTLANPNVVVNNFFSFEANLLEGEI